MLSLAELMKSGIIVEIVETACQICGFRYNALKGGLVIRVGVIGATGYSGAEAVRILAGHPSAEVTYVTSASQVGGHIGDLYPALHRLDLVFEAFDAGHAQAAADVFMVCLPHGEAASFVAALVDGEHKVIDLSADFRLPADLYAEWYGITHPEPRLLSTAVYGLTELNRDAIAAAKLVANPGCYPTGAVLALAPAVSAGLIDTGTIVVDSKSGVSGAGRSASAATHFCEVSDSTKAYNVGVHRHTPEIEQALASLLHAPATVTFTPHLVPMNRGILTTAYANLAANVTVGRVLASYRDFYADAAFVLVRPDGSFPATRDVGGTNECHLGVHVDSRTGRLVVISAIDNLVKGAAGQAVQNMNVMYGLEETAGLEMLGRTV